MLGGPPRRVKTSGGAPDPGGGKDRTGPRRAHAPPRRRATGTHTEKTSAATANAAHAPNRDASASQGSPPAMAATTPHQRKRIPPARTATRMGTAHTSGMKSHLPTGGVGYGQAAAIPCTIESVDDIRRPPIPPPVLTRRSCLTNTRRHAAARPIDGAEGRPTIGVGPTRAHPAHRGRPPAGRLAPPVRARPRGGTR